MNNYYRILGAYAFDETNKETKEKTWKKKYCVVWHLQFRNWGVSPYPYRFYFDEDQFIDMFNSLIDPNDYNLGLVWKYLKVRNDPIPSECVEKVPEEKK